VHRVALTLRAMKRRAQRVTFGLPAVGVIVILLVAGVSWKRLAARYYLRQLMTTPRYLNEVIRSPPGTPRRLALDDYLETREGKQALFEIYADTVLASVFADRADLASTVLEAMIWTDGRRSSYVEWFPARDYASYGIRVHAGSLERAEAIVPLLETLYHEEFALPAYPAVFFRMLPGPEARRGARICGRGPFARANGPDLRGGTASRFRGRHPGSGAPGE
jgi:hypothetical protein